MQSGKLKTLCTLSLSKNIHNDTIVNGEYPNYETQIRRYDDKTVFLRVYANDDNTISIFTNAGTPVRIVDNEIIVG